MRRPRSRLPKWVLVAAVPVLVAAGLAAVLVLGPRPGAERPLAHAERLWVQGRYREALEVYRRYADRHWNAPDADEAFYQMGMLYALFLNDIPSAIRTFELLVTEYPGSRYATTAQRRMATLLEEQVGDLPAAIAVYERLLAGSATGDDARRVRYRLATLHLKRRDYGRARDEMERLLAESPDGPLSEPVRFHLAQAYLLEGRRQDAIATYEAALASYPRSRFASSATFALALAYEEAGDVPKALTLLKSLRRDAPNPAALNSKIAALEEKVGAR